jgi:hypothetical protein
VRTVHSKLHVARIRAQSQYWHPIMTPSRTSSIEPDQCFELIIASVTYPSVTNVIITEVLRGFRRHHSRRKFDPAHFPTDGRDHKRGNFNGSLEVSKRHPLDFERTQTTSTPAIVRPRLALASRSSPPGASQP